MSNKRRRFAASQKAAIVLVVLKEEKSVAQIAAENGVHPNQIHKWKKQALADISQLFEEERRQAAVLTEGAGEPRAGRLHHRPGQGLDHAVSPTSSSGKLIQFLLK